MTTLSRRSFLQVSGLALAAGTLQAPLWGALAQPDAPCGRVLTPIAIFDAAGRPARQLWPDSVVRILDADEHRYRLHDGWVERAAIQPMMPAPPHADWPTRPSLAEVRGSVAPVRRACGVDAALVARVGHGGVLHALDALRDERGAVLWLAVGATPDVLLGWTPAQLWQPVALESLTAGERRLCVDTAGGYLCAFEGDAEVAAAPVALGKNAPSSATTRVAGRQPSAQWNDGETTLSGIPWALRLSGGDLLAGAWWHNQFGAVMPGPALQVAPAFARWLYTWLPDGADVSFG